MRLNFFFFFSFACLDGFFVCFVLLLLACYDYIFVAVFE